MSRKMRRVVGPYKFFPQSLSPLFFMSPVRRSFFHKRKSRYSTCRRPVLFLGFRVVMPQGQILCPRRCRTVCTPGWAREIYVIRRVVWLMICRDMLRWRLSIKLLRRVILFLLHLLRLLRLLLSCIQLLRLVSRAGSRLASKGVVCVGARCHGRAGSGSWAEWDPGALLLLPWCWGLRLILWDRFRLFGRSIDYGPDSDWDMRCENNSIKWITLV